MGGRTRTPTEILLRRGSWHGKRRVKDGEPKPVGDVGPPPTYLGDAAREEWVRCADAIPGLLTAADRGFFVCYCYTVGQLHDHSTGAIELSERQAGRLYERLRKFATGLGFTPAARSRGWFRRIGGA